MKQFSIVINADGGAEQVSRILDALAKNASTLPAQMDEMKVDDVIEVNYATTVHRIS